MARLEENLKLGLEAVKYAKEQVRRSANQVYFKTTTRTQDAQRNQFLIGATRGSSFSPALDQNRQLVYVKNDTMSQRRNELQQIVSSGDPQSVKDRRIDRCIKAWGKNYFQGYDLFAQPETSNGIKLNSRWDTLSSEQKNTKIANKLGISQTEVQQADAKGDRREWDAMYDLFVAHYKADNARKFGVGNCGEKAYVAALYLLDRTPGGLRISVYQLATKHKGITGIITGEGGDHAFAVLGHDAVAGDIGSLGPNAIIVDGWMNDAYPAQKYLSLKHGLNYDNVRINIKQHTTRSMVCCSYRSHIECKRDYGKPPKGPGSIPRPTILRTKL